MNDRERAVSASEKAAFFAKASIAGADQCWEWKGTRGGGDGAYGIINLRHPKKTTRGAHRVAKELAIGRSLTTEENIHHICRNTVCVNPSHLLIVSRSEHKRQYDRITHCWRGHEFTPENTLLNDKGHQICRKCKRLRESRSRAERRRLDPEWRERERLRHKTYRERKNDDG